MSDPLLTGRLLVATPRLGDPTFARAVVLLIDHDEEGSLGVVVNRPTTVQVGDILPDWQDHVTGPDVIFQGGPVALDSALALASVTGAVPAEGDLEPVGWRRVAGALGMVDLDAPPELLVPGLASLRVFAGYAGWGPGQLLAELEEGAWYVVDAEPGDAFTDAPDHLWRQVLRRQRGDLALVATYPEDPQLN
jgi:putative transcriptional regulator